MKPKLPFALGLAYAALAFGILLPPEAYPDGKLAVILCSTFAFLAALAERRISASWLRVGLGAFGLLLAHTLFISVDVYRSLEFLSVLWAYYALLGFFLYSNSDPIKPTLYSIVALCAVVSVYGLYQYFWGFEQMYNFITYSNSEQVFKVPALELVSKGRVFSTLSLPGTLWGFLVLALPLHVPLWKQGKAARTIAAAGIILLLTTGLLTRSFGFLVGLFVLAAAWMARRYQRNAWRWMAALAVVLMIAGAAFYSARHDSISSANPLVLRAKNWLSAWSIFAANPMGTGLNTYGVVYPRYMLPDANETQYTHNTPLQLLSELGLPLLALTGLLLLVLQHRRSKRSAPEGGQERRDLELWIKLALLIWTVHNLIDIDVYFPSVGITGIVLLGTWLWRPNPLPTPPSRILVGLTALVGVAVLGFAGLVMISTELQFRAQAEYEENKLQQAAASLESAKALMPINSSLFHDAGDIGLNLFQKRRDPAVLEAAIGSFRHAIAWSPRKSGSHMGLALSLAAGDRVNEALAEIREAQRLFPDSTYVRSVTRLLEKRLAEAAVKPVPDRIPAK